MAAFGKLICMVMKKKDLLWIKWVNGMYIKGGDDFCNWKKLQKLKPKMTRR